MTFAARWLVLLWWAAAPMLVAAADVTPDAFFRHPDYGSLHLSPSGKYLGALVPVQGRVRLAIIDLDNKTTRIAAAVEGEDIFWFEWVNDERLVFGVVDFQSGGGEQRGFGLFAINRDGSDYRILSATIREQMNRGQFVYRYSELHSLLHDGSDDILVLANDSNAEYPLVYRMNTKTGRKESLMASAPGDAIAWVTDRKGVVRAAYTVEKSTIYRTFWRPDGESKWVQLGESHRGDATFVPLAFDGDGSLIVASNMRRDTFAIYRYDTQKKALGEQLAAQTSVDLQGGLVIDHARNRIVGVRYPSDPPSATWWDDAWAARQKLVDGALPGRVNVLEPADTGSRVLVRSYSDTDPGTYYLYDEGKKRIEFVASVRKGIEPAAMPARLAVRYKARDGLEIPGYLTLPKNKEAKNLPLVVSVHGGPWVRGGEWGWDAEPAYLASLGYAVLEPEFRGSTGRGLALWKAGWRQWGRGMQDDLDDGVDSLAHDGVIDPKRVCIMGGSYGGFAVMSALARDSKRWRCGINIVGVTDIDLMFDVTWSDFARSDFIEFSAKEMIGDPDKDAALFKSVSPLANAAKIRAPVLMAYGGADRRVPIVHGEKMRDALQKQETPVEWIVYRDEGHGFLLEKNRIDFYGRVAAFLAKHLAPE